MLIYNNQEQKAFYQGQQVQGFYHGNKVFGGFMPPKNRKYALVSPGGNLACYLITDEDANSDFQVILDVNPSINTTVSSGLFCNNISSQYVIALFHAYRAMRVIFNDDPFTNVPMNASRTVINYDHNNYYQNDVLLASFPEISPSITNPDEKIRIGIGTDARTWVGKIYGAKLLIGGVLKHDFIPVPAGNTQYSTTPAPSNCMWDTVTEKYFENAGTGTYGIEEYGLINDDFGNDALLFQENTWFNTGVQLVAQPMEVIAKIRTLEEFISSDIIPLFYTQLPNSIGTAPFYVQIIRYANNNFRYSYQTYYEKTDPTPNPINFDEDVILRITDRQYIVNNVAYHTFNSPNTFNAASLNYNIILGVRYDPNFGSVNWWYSGYIYGFRIMAGGALLRNFVPVDVGSTKYSSTPAPSVCMWDTVTQQYYENQGTTPFQFVTVD